MKFFVLSISSLVLFGIATNFSWATVFEMSDPEFKEVAQEVCTQKKIPEDKCEESFKNVTKNTANCLSYEFFKQFNAFENVANNRCEINSNALEDVLEWENRTQLLACNTQFGMEDKCELCAETSECMALAEEDKVEAKAAAKAKAEAEAKAKAAQH